MKYSWASPNYLGHKLRETPWFSDEGALITDALKVPVSWQLVHHIFQWVQDQKILGSNPSHAERPLREWASHIIFYLLLHQIACKDLPVSLLMPSLSETRAPLLEINLMAKTSFPSASTSWMARRETDRLATSAANVTSPVIGRMSSRAG